MKYLKSYCYQSTGTDELNFYIKAKQKLYCMFLSIADHLACIELSD